MEKNTTEAMYLYVEMRKIVSKTTFRGVNFAVQDGKSGSVKYSAVLGHTPKESTVIKNKRAELEYY